MASNAAARRKEGGMEGEEQEGGRERSLGMVRLPAPAPPPPPWRRVCVFTKRNLQLLPRFRRTVSAMPPRYALAATVAAKVTEEEGREVGVQQTRSPLLSNPRKNEGREGGNEWNAAQRSAPRPPSLGGWCLCSILVGAKVQSSGIRSIVSKLNPRSDCSREVTL